MGLNLTIDFEGRSESPLPKVGAYRYSTDPTTEVICLAYTHKDNHDLVRVWIAPWLVEMYGIEPGYQCCETEDGKIEALFVTDDTELRNWLALADTVEAHNAFFERCLWRNKMIPEHNWPDIENHKWKCSAAKAASFSLPRSLDGAGKAMRLHNTKDTEGSKLLKRLMKPMPLRQQKNAGGKYHGSKEEFIRLALYCAQDVTAEEAFSESLPDLIPFEQKVWEVDQAANERGVYCDIDFVDHILDLCDEKVSQFAAELFDLSEGDVTSVGSRKSFIEWVESRGFYDLPNTQGATIDELLERDDIDPVVYRGLQIMRMANKTSTRKFYAMQRRANEDGRIRDTLMYHGASTGRWTGRGVQFQNLPRGMIKNMEVECDFIAGATLEDIEMIYDDAMELFSSAVRGAISSPLGRDLVVADYSSIEARGTAWAAGDESALQIFRDKKDIYLDMASTIYGYEVTKAMADKRQLGKQAILGLGYGMGANKFLTTCWGYNIYFNHKEMLALISAKEYKRIKGAVLKLPMVYFKDEVNKEEHMDDIIIAKYIVDSYRAKYAKTVQFWADCENSAQKAVWDFQEYRDAVKSLKEFRDKYKGKSLNPKGFKVKAKLEKAVTNLKIKKARWHKAGPVKFRVLGRFLMCELPSGRRLAYPYPFIKQKKTSWGKWKDTIHYMGVDSVTKKWGVQTTYGGKLVENVIQAIARDLMANAMLAVDAHPSYDIVLTVHDEIITEADEGVGSLNEFKELLCELPNWAEGFPLAADGWRGKRYKK